MKRFKREHSLQQLLISSLILMMLHAACAQPISTSEVYTRIFRIGYSNGMGTCFAVDVDDKQYIITAKHVVSGIRSNDTVRIFHDSIWKDLTVRRLDCRDTNADVIVLIASRPLTIAGQVGLGAEGTYIGQDVNFLGYPYGMYSNLGEVNANFPFPFVKRAMVSAWDGTMFWLDGYLRPGDSVEARIRRLQGCCGRQEIPTVVIAFDEDRLLGSAMLVEHDMDTRMELSPWLAGVFVAPGSRKQGVGAALVRRVVENATALGVKRLYLYSPSTEAFYSRLGWMLVERTRYQI
jgi:GNAT superfamily N-acetyltransferase